jgi:hypothetical protein
MPLPSEIESDIALVSDAGLGDAQALGGWIEQGSLTVKLLRSSFDGDLPALGDLLTFGGEQYRIIKVENRPSRPVVLLTCAAKDE